MAPEAGLLGVAIVLTLVAGVALAVYEETAERRGLRFRGISRPGAVAMLFGAGAAGLIAGHLGDNLFVLVAGAIAALSGLPVLRTGGRLSSFLVLLVGTTGMVIVLGAEINAFGARPANVMYTAFVIACLCAVLREFDAAGSGGWAVAVVLAAAATVTFVVLDRPGDAAVGVLTTGALFATIAAAPFGAGLLGRVGSRFAGLLIGGLAVRGAVGSPGASLAVAVSAGGVFVLWLATLERPFRRRAILTTVAVGAVLAAAAVPALLALRDVYRPLNRAVATSRGLVGADPTDDLATTASKLTAVEASFRSSARKLRSPLTTGGRLVPFLGSNLRAASVSATSAADLSQAARQLLAQINVGSISVNNATVQQRDLDNLADSLRNTQFVINRSQDDIQAGGATDLLVPQLRDGVRDLRHQLGAVGERIDTSLDGTVAAKRLLGFDRPRRYFVAVQNTAESRATGGYIANYGILVADKGRVSLADFRRTSEFDEAADRPRVLHASKDYRRRYSRFDVASNWVNVNMSPDFPTVARVMADQYRQFSGKEVDGVLAIDPVVLSRFLDLTGPVQVPGWPVPIGATNVVPVMLHDEYVAFASRPDSVRIDFLGRVAKGVFDQITSKGLTDLKRAGRIVRELTASRNLQFYATDELATRFFQATRSDGAVPPASGDAVMVTTQNAAANKTDYFLHRSIKYEADVRAIEGGFQVDSVLTISLRNDAPSSGEPRYVIGPYDGGFQPGQNRTYLTVYSPIGKTRATVDGEPLLLEGSPEAGRIAHSAFVDIAAGSTRTVRFRFSGVLSGNKRYVLDVVRQPLVHHDAISLQINGLGVPRRVDGPLKRNLHLVIKP
ncbi:MAG TPA: DUF4012 domain-containing protein [Acidimicrobiales bacterium]|nr:DUF4012 domain-containing protein [Acidimicrobiales bacterium]